MLHRFFCLAVLVVAFVSQGAAVNAADPKPNLIAIVTDDQGRWAMGTYGNRDIKTPNMDRIGREGAVFTQAFTVTPVCSPSRAAYMSGLWPTEVKITDYIEASGIEENVGLDALTWPEVLQQNGYRTALVGKWHLGSKPEFHPTKMGFDHFTGIIGGGTSPMNPKLEINGQVVETKGPFADVVTSDAIEFIRANRDKPFAVCLHFREPHLPYTPVAEEDAALYKGTDPEIPNLKGLDVAKVKQAHRDYYSSISAVDRNLGRLLAALDELKLADNTLVTFTSDHGYNEGRHYISTKGNGTWIAGGMNGPKRPNMFETSIRVPLVMRWPKVIKPGTHIDYPVSNLDMFRTMLGALKVAKPANAPARGLDYSPLLRGEMLPERGPIFGQYDLHNFGLAYMRMIRTPKYKLVKFYKANSLDELYDLEHDPDETTNLLGKMGDRKKHKPLVDELTKQLQEWMRSIDDPLLKASY